jgi:DNA-binding response OmpR family regulator
MARSRESAPVLAVVNSNDDLVGVLKDTLERKGFSVVTAHVRDFRTGPRDFGAFLDKHNPSVVIYDIAIPYEENWAFLQTLREHHETQRTSFVVTTVNHRVLTERVGPNEAIELQGGHADDLDPLLDVIRGLVRPPD